MTAHTAGPLTIDGNLNIKAGNAPFKLLGTVTPLSPGASQDEAEANSARLVACWNACEGISTSVLEKGRVSSDAFQMEESRADKAEQLCEDLLAALKAARNVLDEVQGDINPERGYADELENDVSSALGAASSAIEKAEAQDLASLQTVEVIELTPEAFDAFEQQLKDNPLAGNKAAQAMLASPGRWPGAFNATPQRYTSISKGGTYEKLGAIRGAGQLKGLSGIAYRNDAGDLFIREPECFAARMVVIPGPADAVDGGAV